MIEQTVFVTQLSIQPSPAKVIGLTHIIEVRYIRGDGSGLVTQKKAAITCSRFIWIQIVEGKLC